MLPHQDLEASYEKAVWIWVCRTWREDEADLEAARIHDRLGVTSWPHLFVIDPRTDEVLVRAGRSTKAIESAIARGTEAVEADAEATGTWLSDLEAAREAILEVEKLSGAKDAAARKAAKRIRPLLDHPDVVVRIRAVRWLLEREPETVLGRAEALILAGNDPLAVLEGVKEHPSPELSALLARIVVQAGKGVPSGNPNVLRGKAARCLVTSGDARAIDALAPIAKEANYRNSTTRAVVEALGAIGARGDEATRTRVTAILLASWPPPVDEDVPEKQARILQRYAVGLARAVTDALAAAHDGKGLPKLPDAWTKADRDAHVEAVAKRFD